MNGLRVAVIGGGIGGMAVANALHRRGIAVHLYEQAAAFTEVGAGIVLQPNGLRMLRRLGFGEELARLAAPWLDSRFLRADGSYAASMWPADLSRRIEFYGIHRADLLGMLKDRLPSGIAKAGFKCIGFEQDDSGAVITFQNGGRIEADAVIAADGIHSWLQQFVVASSAPTPSGTVAYRGVVPAQCLQWPAGAMRIWLGAGKHFLVYPVRAGTLLNCAGYVQADEEMKESWSAPGDPRALAREFSNFDPMVGSVIGKITSTFRWGLYDREPLSTWVHGRLALMGDAAHPMLPHSGQGANQAIEDAVTLAALLSRCDRSSVPKAFQTYEALRRDRCARVQRGSRVNGARFDAKEHELAERDQMLAAQVEERAWVWNYDAELEAERALAQTRAST
jgi:salicylate hydroxylase